MHQKYQDDVAYAKLLDQRDPLRHFRERFYVKEGEIYMCGNSLGLASKDAENCVLELIEKWKNEGVKIWTVDNSKYYLYSNYLAKIMSPILGAEADEIAITGGTTINIHQAISTLYNPTKEKFKILVDDINFATDRYAVDSQVRLRGYNVEDAVKVVKSKENFMSEEDIIEEMTEDIALVLLPAVYFKSAQVLDMKKLTKAAKDRGIIIGWDLSHGVGAIEINLKDIDADFAVWCTYKYLNGGPGSVAGLYINRRHFDILPGLAGWFGNKHETQFLISQQFDHNQNASGWQIGTPGLFSMAALEGSLKIIIEAGVAKMREKSLHITGYLMYLIEHKLACYGFSFGNKKEDSKRGGHVCLQHAKGHSISISLKYRGVVCDFRPPNVIRLTPTALYTRYEDVYNMVQILIDIMESESYKKYEAYKTFVL